MNRVFERLSDEQRKVLCMEQRGKNVEFLCRTVASLLVARRCFKSSAAVIEYIVDSTNPFHPSFILALIPELHNYDVAFVLASLLLEPGDLAKVSLRNVLKHAAEDCCHSAGVELIKLTHAIFEGFTNVIECYEYLTAATNARTPQWFAVVLPSLRQVDDCFWQTLSAMSQSLKCIAPSTKYLVQTAGRCQDTWAGLTQASMHFAISFHVEVGDKRMDEMEVLRMEAYKSHRFLVSPKIPDYFFLRVTRECIAEYIYDEFLTVKLSGEPNPYLGLENDICTVRMHLADASDDDAEDWRHVYIDLDLRTAHRSATDAVAVFVDGCKKQPLEYSFASAELRSAFEKGRFKWKPYAMYSGSTSLRDLMFLDRSRQHRDSPPTEPSVHQLVRCVVPATHCKVLMAFMADGTRHRFVKKKKTEIVCET